MRIGFVSGRADLYGGGQRSLLDLAAGLGGGGCGTLVVLPGPGPLAEALVAARVRTIFLDLPPLRRRCGAAAIVAAARLARLARRERLDVLHSDSPRTALYAGLASRLAPCRHVWHLRASRPSPFLPDGLLLLLTDAAVAVSRAAGRRSAALRRSKKVRVIPTGLAPAGHLERRAARAALRLPETGFVAATIGRVEPDKGGADAIAALGAIRRIHPEALLVFLGEVACGGAWASALCRLADRLGLRGAIRFEGPLPAAAPILPAFDLLLHPSRHEALPRVLIEAQQAGLPAVAYAVGGVPEVIEDGRTGLLVAPGAGPAFAAAAAALAGDAALRRRLASAGSERAERHFRLETMLGSIRALYEDMLAHPAGTAPAGEAAR